MTTARWLPFLLLVAGCAASDGVPMSHPQDEAAAPGEHKDLAYGDDPRQRLDLFVPTGKKGEPLVVFVHGGAWKGGERAEYVPFARKLQGEGIAAATIEYRLSPAVRHPAHAEDAAHALAWLHAHAGAYGYDPRRIVLVGHSAGAHIAATIATDARLLALAQPAGFVGLEGIYDVPDLAHRWPGYDRWFLNAAFGEDPSKWPAASPTRARVVSQAPWLLVQSKGDELVDAGQTDGFARHLKEAGIAVEVVRPEGETHDGVVRDLAKGNEAARAIRRFVSGLPRP